MWSHQPASTALPFDEFCKDVVRWGTSGGAPTVEILGQKQRSKWAWGFKTITDAADPTKLTNVNPYVVASKMPNLSKVALKEEPKKTREIPLPCHHI